jgi:hypothetical protein
MEFKDWFLLAESFNSPLPIRWTKRNNRDWEGSFNVPIQNKVFSSPIGNNLNHAPNFVNPKKGKQYIIRMMKDVGMPWEVKFELVMGDERTQDITGTGDAAVVFSTVLNGIQQWMTAVNPTIFAITAREENRQSLYLKMIQRMLGKQ